VQGCESIAQTCASGGDNMEISIKTYAETVGISHQAVYQQISNHKEEIEPHIVKRGNTRYLTDKAVEILDNLRKDNPLAVHQVQQNEQIALLQNDLQLASEREKALMQTINDLRKQLQMKAEEEAKNAFMIASASQMQEKIDAIPEQIKAAEDKKELEMRLEFKEREQEIRDEMQAKIDDFKPTFFGFYRKKSK